MMSFFQDDYDEERETNLSAVVAAMQLWEGQPTVSNMCPVLTKPGTCRQN